MKKINKLLSIASIAVVSSTAVIGYASANVVNKKLTPHKKDIVTPNEDFTYQYDSDLKGYILTSYNGTEEVVLIPDQYNGTDVVAIGDGCFENKTFLRGVGSHRKIVKIGAHAFSGCYNLESIKMGEDYELKTIGKRAFSGCTKLNNLYMPNAIQVIDDFAFEKCYSLAKITDYNQALPNLTRIGKGAFMNCSNLGVEDGQSEPVVRLDSPKLTVIDDSAFKGCSSMAYVRLANEDWETSALTRIGNNAFQGCSKLASIWGLKYCTNLTVIGNSAFKDCSSIQFDEQDNDCVLPDSVTSIGTCCFMNCSSICKKYWDEKSLVCGFHMPTNVTSIPAYAFYGCQNIAITNFDKCNITEIGDYAFWSDNMTDVSDGWNSYSSTFPKTLEKIGNNAFEQTTLNTTITIPNNCSIGKAAFRYAKIGSIDLSSWTQLPTNEQWPLYDSWDKQFYDINYKNGYIKKAANSDLNWFEYFNEHCGSDLQSKDWHYYVEENDQLEIMPNWNKVVTIGGKNSNNPNWASLTQEIRFNIKNPESWTQEIVDELQIEFYRQDSYGEKMTTGWANCYDGENQILISKKLDSDTKQLVLTFTWNPERPFWDQITQSGATLHLTHEGLNLDYYMHDIKARFFSRDVSTAIGGTLDCERNDWRYYMYLNEDGSYLPISCETNTLLSNDPNLAKNLTITVLNEENEENEYFEADNSSIFVDPLYVNEYSYKATEAGCSDLVKFKIKAKDGASFEIGQEYAFKLKYTYKKGDETFVHINDNAWRIVPTIETPNMRYAKVGSFLDSTINRTSNANQYIDNPTDDNATYTVQLPKVWRNISDEYDRGQWAKFDADTTYKVSVCKNSWSEELFNVEINGSDEISASEDGSLDVRIDVSLTDEGKEAGGWKIFGEDAQQQITFYVVVENMLTGEIISERSNDVCFYSIFH